MHRTPPCPLMVQGCTDCCIARIRQSHLLKDANLGCNEAVWSAHCGDCACLGPLLWRPNGFVEVAAVRTDRQARAIAKR